MSGDQLTARTPGDRVITEYVGDHAGMADCAAQLQQTGEETLELHQFMMSIINNEIEVQEGISIEQLRDMAMTVGDGLGPLGEYFCELATATWAYAEASRVAGDLTEHMFGRAQNLASSLATLVAEREESEGWLSSTQNLPEDGEAHGHMIPYSVLDGEGVLNTPGFATSLYGLPKEEALRKIESHLVAVQTLHESVHSRNDEQLKDFDSAVDDWEISAKAFVQALDGILGTLTDTDAENKYQQLGNVGEVAAWVGTAADVGSVIPFPPVALGAALVGVLATAVEVAANGGQALKAEFQPGEDSIRIVEGQVFGEGEQAAVASSGFIPVVDLLRKVTRAGEKTTAVAEGIDTAAGVPVEAGSEGRQAGLPVDVGVSADPINAWQQAADATNPRGSASPAGGAMPTYEERAESVALPEPAPEPKPEVEPLVYTPPERPSIADLPTTPANEPRRVKSFEEIMNEGE